MVFILFLHLFHNKLWFFLIKGAINKLRMYKYLQKNSLNMITNVNSSLPEVYFVIYDWLGTSGIYILIGISLSLKYVL